MAQDLAQAVDFWVGPDFLPADLPVRAVFVCAAEGGGGGLFDVFDYPDGAGAGASGVEDAGADDGGGGVAAHVGLLW